MKRLICVIMCLALVCPLAFADGVGYGGYSYYAATTLAGSSANKIHNVELAASRIDGWVVYQGESFSFNNAVGPRTQEYGYKLALNGRGANVRGGGVAQVATTIYQAVRQAGVQFTSLSFYGDAFTDNYAYSGDEAVLVDYNAGTDMVFYNNIGTITINVYVQDYGLNCTISVNGGGYQPYPDNCVGSAMTYLVSGDNQKTNATLAADSISYTTLSYGQEFSFNGLVGPRSREAGYKNAVNGRGVNVRGGGVAQVASTIYLAIKNLSNVRITEKSTYGDNYNQYYVTYPEDAIMVDYSADHDFSFVYLGRSTLTVVTYVSGNELHCEIYEGSGEG